MVSTNTQFFGNGAIAFLKYVIFVFLLIFFSLFFIFSNCYYFLWLKVTMYFNIFFACVFLFWFPLQQHFLVRLHRRNDKCVHTSRFSTGVCEYVNRNTVVRMVERKRKKKWEWRQEPQLTAQWWCAFFDNLLIISKRDVEKQGPAKKNWCEKEKNYRDSIHLNFHPAQTLKSVIHFF